jgi:hypothetical protein
VADGINKRLQNGSLGVGPPLWGTRPDPAQILTAWSQQKNYMANLIVKGHIEKLIFA